MCLNSANTVDRFSLFRSIRLNMNGTSLQWRIGGTRIGAVAAQGGCQIALSHQYAEGVLTDAPSAPWAVTVLCRCTYSASFGSFVGCTDKLNWRARYACSGCVGFSARILTNNPTATMGARCRSVSLPTSLNLMSVASSLGLNGRSFLSRNSTSRRRAFGGLRPSVSSSRRRSAGTGRSCPLSASSSPLSGPSSPQFGLGPPPSYPLFVVGAPAVPFAAGPRT